jgi:3-vinyl bacteriochlorophyllide hydratase
MPQRRALTADRRPLYTTAERERRDATRWTLVQGVLAPLQFLAFAVSLALVARFLITGEGFWAATASILVKTGLLYAIMVTGSIWEKAVFGRWLFAPAFFWEDVVSMGVIALHTAYLFALFSGADPRLQMAIALAAYTAYAINAAQFLLKLRAARLEGDATRSSLLPSREKAAAQRPDEGTAQDKASRWTPGAALHSEAPPYPLPRAERGSAPSRLVAEAVR